MKNSSYNPTKEHSTSLWPPILGLGAGLFSIAVLMMSNKQILPAIAIIAFYLILLMLFIFQETSKTEKTTYEEEKLNLPKYTFMWVFLATEVLFFGLFIGISFALRIRSTTWADFARLLIELCGFNFQQGAITPPLWPNASKVLDIPLTALNTFVLIISSVTMVKAVESIEKNDLKGLRNFLILTFAFGTVFLSIQIIEYLNLFSKGFTPDSSLFAATFFLQTGFHGAHVLFGIILLFFIIIKAHRGGYTKSNYSSVESVGLYWHFVDLVWIILFTVIYLL